MHVCLVCKEVYEPRFLPQPKNEYENDVPCPKLNCYGHVVELDDLIGISVLLLNDKGYYTKYACSGHWFDLESTPYCLFHDGFAPSYPPEGFNLEPDITGNLNIIRAKKEDEYESMYDFVIRSNKELYNWTISLPTIREEDGEYL